MSEDRPSTHLANPEDSRTLRDQESILILLNLGLLTAIAVVHVLFGPALGPPNRGFFAVLMGRFLMQTLELAWLNGGQAPPGARALRAYAGASIWVNIAFAFVIALFGGMEDTHYVVLMVIPVIAAAFRYGATGMRGRRRDHGSHLPRGLDLLPAASHHGDDRVLRGDERRDGLRRRAPSWRSLVRHLRREQGGCGIPSGAGTSAGPARLRGEARRGGPVRGRDRTRGAQPRHHDRELAGAGHGRERRSASKRGEWFEVAERRGPPARAPDQRLPAYARQRQPARRPRARCRRRRATSPASRRPRLPQAGLQAQGSTSSRGLEVDGRPVPDPPGAPEPGRQRRRRHAGRGGDHDLGAAARRAAGVELCVENAGPAIPADVVPNASSNRSSRRGRAAPASGSRSRAPSRAPTAATSSSRSNEDRTRPVRARSSPPMPGRPWR